MCFHYDRLVKSERPQPSRYAVSRAGQRSGFVEAGFIAAASVLPPKNIVLPQGSRADLHQGPSTQARFVRFESKIVKNRQTVSLTVYVQILVANSENTCAEGVYHFCPCG